MSTAAAIPVRPRSQPRARLRTRVHPRPPRPAGVLALAEPTASGAQEPVSAEVMNQVLGRLRTLRERGERARVDLEGRVIIEFRRRSPGHARRRLQHLVRALAAQPMVHDGRTLHLDVSGVWGIARDEAAFRRLGRAADRHLGSRDLMLRSADDTPRGMRNRPATTAAQVLLSYGLSLGLPLAVLVGAHSLGVDVSGYLYWLLVGTLAFAAASQWAEALHAVRPPRVPEAPSAPAPRASAIIAAYLPNEADTILETLEHFFAQRYSGGLQVILAYNTPRELPVEEELRLLEARTPDFRLVRVLDSTSKAQNVNAALSVVDGAFVGVFDADHHPMAGAFERAWRWIASGVDIVQGHCLIRNGDESFIARMTSVEFEQIYAVSHPGRQLLHGFGVFGGSNGFWRTQLLREIRLRGYFLTEDIDASIRSVREGYRIVNDPGLVSRELAPTTLRNLSRQRLRWAQGWFQVTLRHLHSVLLVDTRMSAAQRRGLVILLGWREAFLWLTALMPAVLLFFVWRDGGFHPTSTILLLFTLFTFASGPVQVWFASRLGAPEIRRDHGRWWLYLVFSLFFYQEYKNLLGRLAQIKHLCGERHWAVTPRSLRAPSAPRMAPSTSPIRVGFDEVAA